MVLRDSFFVKEIMDICKCNPRHYFVSPPLKGVRVLSDYYFDSEFSLPREDRGFWVDYSLRFFRK